MRKKLRRGQGLPAEASAKAGEIATLVALGSLVFILVTSVVTNLINKQRQTTKTKALELECTYSSDCGTNYKCVNYKCVPITNPTATRAPTKAPTKAPTGTSGGSTSCTKDCPKDDGGAKYDWLNFNTCICTNCFCRGTGNSSYCASNSGNGVYNVVDGSKCCQSGKYSTACNNYVTTHPSPTSTTQCTGPNSCPSQSGSYSTAKYWVKSGKYYRSSGCLGTAFSTVAEACYQAGAVTPTPTKILSMTPTPSILSVCPGSCSSNTNCYYGRESGGDSYCKNKNSSYPYCCKNPYITPIKTPILTNTPSPSLWPTLGSNCIGGQNNCESICPGDSNGKPFFKITYLSQSTYYDSSCKAISVIGDYCDCHKCKPFNQNCKGLCAEYFDETNTPNKLLYYKFPRYYKSSTCNVSEEIDAYTYCGCINPLAKSGFVPVTFTSTTQQAIPSTGEDCNFGYFPAINNYACFINL